jgi:hypothetical protein
MVCHGHQGIKMSQVCVGLIILSLLTVTLFGLDDAVYLSYG